MGAYFGKSFLTGNLNVNEEKIESPGSYEDLHKATKDVFPINFDGIRLCIKKGLSDHFQVSHTLNIGCSAQGGYRFGSTYVGDKPHGPQEAYPVILGDIDPSGNMNANIVHHITDKLRAKVLCQFSTVNKQSVCLSQIQADYLGNRSTTSIAAANIDMVNMTGVILSQYLFSLSRNIAIGGELLYQLAPQIPGNTLPMLTLGFRYTHDDWIGSGSVGMNALTLCYFHKCSEQIDLGCQVESNLLNGQLSASFAYQTKLPKLNLNFNGMIDLNGTVSAVFDKRFEGLPFNLSLSGSINHWSQNCKVGCGFTVN